MKVALRLEGLARHASTHAAGVVISPKPLTELVPVYKTNRDEITTQYDMNALERIGLLKMDFLGLTTLTVLHDAVKMVQQNRGVKIELDDLLLDDEATYKLFSRGDTTASSSLNRTACATSFAAIIPPASRISPPSTHSIAPVPFKAAWSMTSSIVSRAKQKLPTNFRN